MQPGNLIGNYRIHSELGSGVMGIVYKAHRLADDLPVALKVLPSHLAENSKLLKQFVAEASTTGRLEHPNIVTIYAAGRDGGVHFIATEFVEGITLAEHIDTNVQLKIPAALNVALQIADALEEAHKYGIVHQDIKPENIMVEMNGRVKVMDFGLAKIIQESTSQSGSGFILGTPRYMSPEQVEDQPVRQPTDIFSLGVTLYEMLTGCPPFENESPFILMDQIVNDTPRDMRELNPSISQPVFDLVNKMMEKDPARRHGTAARLRQEIRRLIRSEKAGPQKSAAAPERPTATAAQPQAPASLPVTALPQKSAPKPKPAPPQDPSSTASSGDTPKPRTMLAIIAAGIIVVAIVAAAFFAGAKFASPNPNTSPTLQETQPAESSEGSEV